jgi:acyl dehydratase
MPLRSDCVGLPLANECVQVTPRMALAYAAGIDDPNAVCTDDLSPDFMAPPYFCVSLEWRLVLINRQRGMGLSPEDAARSVHVGQNTQFLAPIRPGMTVRITSRMIEARQTRAGALSRARFEITDAQSGAPLSVSLSTSLYRGVSLEGPDCAEPDIADVTEDWKAPAAWERAPLYLDRWVAHRYTECAAIWNPIHTERGAAHAAGLSEPIVHGTALWALAGRELVARYTPDAPQRLKALSGRFSAMVQPDCEIILEHGPLPRDGAIAFTVRNGAGAFAIARGSAMIAEA